MLTDATPQNAVTDEFGQKGPYESPTLRAYFNLIKSCEVLRAPHDILLKKQNISPTQANVLKILSQAGPEGMPMHEIAGRLVTREPDITRLIERMKREGLVERRRSDRDRRVVLVTTTQQGQQCFEHIHPLLLKLTDLLYSHMSEEEIETLTKLLHKLRTGADLTELPQEENE